MTWPIIPPALQAQIPLTAEFGYTAPVSQRKRLTGDDSPNGAVTSRNTCTSDCGVFSSEPNASARPYRARADSLVARTGEPQGSPVLHRSVNPVRAASHLTVGSAALQSETGARAMSQTLVTVDFHGQSLVAALIDGKPYVAMKPICENIGLQWEAQLKRIHRNHVLSTCMSMMDIQVPGDDQRRSHAFMPLDMLNGWLFGVDVNRVKDEIKPKIIRYQEECYRVLFQHFMPQQAAQPAPAIDCERISPAQAQELKELVQAVVDTGKQKHGETWARLHRKFRVNSYLELPAAQFAEARDYLLGKLPEPQPIPRFDTQALQDALAASNAIASQVQAVAFAQLLSHADAWHNERWMLAFVEGRDGKLQPYAKMLAHDAIAMPVAQIARAIATSDLQPSPEELAALLTACSNQLARHAGRQLTH